MHTIRFDSIDSTNAAGRRMLDAGELADRTLIIATEQTAGRGTKGRSWSSPRDAGIYMTFARVFSHPSTARPAQADGDHAQHRDREGAAFSTDGQWPVTSAYTLAAGLACAKVLRDAIGIDVRVKPINDLLVAGRKLGGILTESVVDAGRLRALLTGVGVNVHRAPLDLPVDAPTPTWLEDHMPSERLAAISIEPFVQTLAAAIDDWHASVAAGRIDRLTAAWPRLGLPDTPLPKLGSER